jgi:hypothetical protein
VVSESFTSESFAAALEGLTVERVQAMKLGADTAAHVLNADSNRDTVIRLVSDAIANRRAR